MKNTIATVLDPTLRSHFDILYRPKKLFGKSPETVRLYGYTFRYYAEFLGRDPELRDLTDESIMGLMEWIRAKPLSLRTANKTRDQLCALWSFLARKGLVSTFPEVPSFDEPERTPVAWTQSQIRLLWECCEAQGGYIGGIPAGLYWLALHSVAWDSLERIGAVKQVKRSDLRMEGTWIHFRAETRKGRRKDSTSRLHPTTTRLLTRLCQCQPDEPLLFPWPMHPSYFWIRYRTMRERAGLPTDREHSFHCIRKTGASFAEAAGADASRLLGHSGRTVTDRHYIDPTVSQREQACDFLFRPDGPEPPRAA
jgi:integrase